MTGRASVQGPAGQAAARARAHLGAAVTAEDEARARWEAAASALATAQRQATGNPTYTQSAYAWADNPPDHPDPTVRAELTRLGDREASTRADRDRAGQAVVAARQSVHHAQHDAELEWLTAG